MGQNQKGADSLANIYHFSDVDVSESYLMVLKTADRVNRFHCVVTQPLNYFAVWLKSLNRFSVYQINLFPTAGQALGLITTLAYAWVSDGLGGKRWQVMIVPAVSNSPNDLSNRLTEDQCRRATSWAW